jgi:hypothetical protein
VFRRADDQPDAPRGRGDLEGETMTAEEIASRSRGGGTPDGQPVSPFGVTPDTGGPTGDRDATSGAGLSSAGDQPAPAGMFGTDPGTGDTAAEGLGPTDGLTPGRGGPTGGTPTGGGPTGGTPTGGGPAGPGPADGLTPGRGGPTGGTPTGGGPTGGGPSGGDPAGGGPGGSGPGGFFSPPDGGGGQSRLPDTDDDGAPEILDNQPPDASGSVFGSGIADIEEILGDGF